MPSSDAIFEALDSIHCGLLVRGRNNEIALANERLASWLGYTRQELVGRPTEELVPPELREIMLDERAALEAGDTRARLMVIQRKDSSTFPVVVIPNQLFDDDGKPIGGVTLFIDLASVQTAKPAGYHGPENLSSQLSRIAFELQTLGLAVSLPEC